MNLKEKLDQIKLKILSINSDNKKTKLIAVSKNFPASKVLELYDLGQKDFAENYVDEFLEKKKSLKQKNICWHFIGKIQSNKVNELVGKADLIHSVDRLKILEKINLKAGELNLKQKILIQIKFGNEKTKSGFDREDVDRIFENISEYKNIEIQGLMTILPLGLEDNEKMNLFGSLQKKLVELKKAFSLTESFSELSMGMTDDFELAISKGSTMIRIGRALFGERNDA